MEREEAMMEIGNGKENDELRKNEVVFVSGLVAVGVEFTKVELVGGKGEM